MGTLKMVGKIALLVFAFILILKNAAADETPDLYCKSKPSTYHICRKCPNLEDNCDGVEKCQCENIQLYNHDKHVLQGGSDCKSIGGRTGKAWCYVSANSPCADVQRQTDPALTYRKLAYDNKIWHNNPIHGSYDACKQENRLKSPFPGDEDVLFGTK